MFTMRKGNKVKLDKLIELSKTRASEKWCQSSVEINGSKMNMVSLSSAIFDPMDTDKHICFADPSKPEITEFIVEMKKHFDALAQVAKDADWYCKWDGAGQRNTLRKSLKKVEEIE